MTNDLEQRLRVAFHEDAQSARLVNLEGPVDPDERPPAPYQRPRSPRWLVAAAVLIVAGLVGALLIRDGDGADREVTTSPGRTPRNGSIVASDGDADGWPAGAAAPMRPDDAGSHAWDGFDPGSGSFLYVSRNSLERIWVLDEHGEEKADFDCGWEDCALAALFGPGPDEVTLVVWDERERRQVPERLQVTAWDGTVRENIDISAAFNYDANGTVEQSLAALAWSPDGTRLAVATAPGHGCDPLQDPCAAQVWTFDRQGHDPQLVHTAPSDDQVAPGSWGPTEFGDLAWSPDGRRLGVVVAPSPVGAPPWPRLVVLRFQPDGTVLADTLHEYDRAIFDDDYLADSYLIQMVYGTTFAFAWSPDGTRLAVVGESGVEEISAEDGRVLARHPGVGSDGEVIEVPDPPGGGSDRNCCHSHDLAWLPAS